MKCLPYFDKILTYTLIKRTKIKVKLKSINIDSIHFNSLFT